MTGHVYRVPDEGFADVLRWARNVTRGVGFAPDGGTITLGGATGDGRAAWEAQGPVIGDAVGVPVHMAPLDAVEHAVRRSDPDDGVHALRLETGDGRAQLSIDGRDPVRAEVADKVPRSAMQDLEHQVWARVAASDLLAWVRAAQHLGPGTVTAEVVGDALRFVAAGSVGTMTWEPKDWEVTSRVPDRELLATRVPKGRLYAVARGLPSLTRGSVDLGISHGWPLEVEREEQRAYRFRCWVDRA